MTLKAPSFWNANIEVVQAGRAWYYSHMSAIKGREGVDTS